MAATARGGGGGRPVVPQPEQPQRCPPGFRVVCNWNEARQAFLAALYRSHNPETGCVSVGMLQVSGDRPQDAIDGRNAAVEVFQELFPAAPDVIGSACTHSFHQNR
jgi:hypothetical protein